MSAPIILQTTAIFLAMTLIACDNRRVLYRESVSVGAEYEWATNEPLTFSIDVSENKHPYELALQVRCATGYPYDKLLMHVTETNPAGERVRRDVEVPIRNAQGEFYGDKGFDIIDIELVLDHAKEFPTFGTYTYTLEPNMPEIDPIVYVLELGMLLRDPLVK